MSDQNSSAAHRSLDCLFDREWMLEQIAGDEALLHAVIDVFLDDCPRQEEELLHALDSGSTEKLRAAAHSAKSAVGNFGPGYAHKAAIALENACKSDENASFPALTDALLQRMQALKQALIDDQAQHPQSDA